MAHNPTHPYESSASEANQRRQQQKAALKRNLAHRNAQLQAKTMPAKPAKAKADKPADAS